MSSRIGVYIHVPYCRVACPYCDFVKKPVAAGEADGFAEALCAEIRAFEGPSEALSVFFGGGTPSLLGVASMARIFEALRERFAFDEPEVSIEANPDDISAELIACWKDVGVNRVTLGVQSFDDEALGYLGRCHDAETARRACDAVGAAFENWGMDLIFGAHPAESWGRSLDECLGFDPAHLSTYGLTFEQGTPFWKRRGEEVDSDASLELYRAGMAALDSYEHYEVSNFAKAGYESAHNMVYWRNDEYAGFGPGAYSYLNGVRSRNAVSIRGYADAPGRKGEALRLSEQEIRLETLLQHFRTKSGLDKGYYAARFGDGVEADFGEAVARLVKRDLIEDTPERLRPTRKGYELNNEIGLELVSEGASAGY